MGILNDSTKEQIKAQIKEASARGESMADVVYVALIASPFTLAISAAVALGLVFLGMFLKTC